MNNLLDVKFEAEKMIANSESQNFNSVILLTDFSDGAKNAIRYVIEAFGETTKYILVNAYYARTSSATLLDINDILAKESEDGLVQEIDWIRKTYPHLLLDVSSKSVFGTPIDAIKQMSKDKNNDLMVMGTTGASGIDAVLFGSVAESVIRNTVVPVLAVPKNCVYKGFNQLVFATDLNTNYGDVTLSPIRKIQSQFGTKVNVFSVIKPNQLVDLSHQKIDLENVKYSTSEEENIVESVHNYCSEIRADILAVLPQHTGFFDRLFHHSISKEIILAANLPILALEQS